VHCTLPPGNFTEDTFLYICVIYLFSTS
jgi:hypothetical protein